MKTYLTTLMLPLLLLGCAKKVQSDGQTNTIDGRWLLISIGSDIIATPKESKPPYIQFQTEDMQLSGYGGCNQFHADIVEWKGETLRIGAIASTKRMCSNSKTESRYMDKLSKTYAIRFRDDLLILIDNRNHPLLTFKPSPLN